MRFFGKYIHEKPLLNLDYSMYKDLKLMFKDKKKFLKVEDLC